MAITTGERAGTDGCISGLRAGLPARMARRGEGAARLSSVILAIVLGVFALASCAPGVPSVKAPMATPAASASATASPSPTAIPRLIYQTDWSHGLDGWMATPGWSVSGGALQSDMGTEREITSSFHPGTSNYAIEVRFQIVAVSQRPPTQLDLSADATSGAGGNRDGFIFLMDSVALTYVMFAQHPHVEVYIDPMVDMDLSTYQPHDFEPGSHWHIYRVEVRGPWAVLSIDGHFISSALSAKTSQLSTGPLHFSCSGVALRLSDFKVYAL